MTDSGKDNQDSTDREKKEIKILSISISAIFVVLFFAVAGIWYTAKNEQKTYDNLVQSTIGESGRVLGALIEDPEFLTKLASNLKAAGFVLYGSNGDEKTEKQKEVFGQAYSSLDYVECNPQVKNSNALECVARGIEKYPTWVSGDKLYPGYKSPTELEEILLVGE